MIRRPHLVPTNKTERYQGSTSCSIFNCCPSLRVPEKSAARGAVLRTICSGATPQSSARWLRPHRLVLLLLLFCPRTEATTVRHTIGAQSAACFAVVAEECVPGYIPTYALPRDDTNICQHQQQQQRQQQ